MFPATAEIQGALLAGEFSSARVSANFPLGQAVIPPRMLEILVTLNNFFDTQSFADDSP